MKLLKRKVENKRAIKCNSSDLIRDGDARRSEAQRVKNCAAMRGWYQKDRRGRRAHISLISPFSCDTIY